MAFAPSSTEVAVHWDLFADAESSLSSFKVELMMQPSCDVRAAPGGDVIDSVVIDASYSSYIFRLSDKGMSLTVRKLCQQFLSPFERY